LCGRARAVGPSARVSTAAKIVRPRAGFDNVRPLPRPRPSDALPFGPTFVRCLGAVTHPERFRGHGNFSEGIEPMRLTISLAASLALAALLLAACNPQDSSAPAANANAARPAGAATPQKAAATPAATPAADGVRRMTVQEARAAADAGRAIIYDVRTKESFATGHIKGARLVPHDAVEQHLSEFPKDKLIITYCA